jgi:hypothetical protein
MGYECPVCATPQADRRHLADHLAVTAMTHGDDHADWLDDHVPDWSAHSPAELGDAVAEHAPEGEYDRVFEDTVGTDGDGDHAAGRLDEAVGPGHGAGVDGDLTEAGRAAVEEARELTRRMLDADDRDEADEDADGSQDE